jgi:uncharacterized protein
MHVTALFAALLAPLYILLTLRVIGLRRSVKVALGPGDNEELLRRMRVHANFAENVPLALILLGLAESLQTPAIWLYVLGTLLLMGRLSHAYGVSQMKEVFAFRVTGMALTFTAIGLAAATCLALALGLKI